MKIIDGRGATMGRLASYVAKESLKGEEISIINCEKMIITGSLKNIQREFEESRKRVGSGQLGPKISRDKAKIVKRAIRGMLPHREGRGREALKRIRCYKGIPKELEGKKTVITKKERKTKYVRVEEI